MSALEDDWRADLDEIDAALVDEYQSGFPVVERPFRVVGDDLGIGEEEALDRVRRLRERGVFRRFGAVLNPPVIGSSTLAAVSAPEERFDEVAEVINGYRQVNHNYRRDHEWNMWFVVTAASREKRDSILDEIEERTGCEVLNLPMLTDYYIDLEFPVVNDDSFARESLAATDASATRISEEAAGDLTELEADLLVAIQDGFPLSSTPYRDIAAQIDADRGASDGEDAERGAGAGAGVDDVIDAVERLLDDGCIKRIGCIVNHVVTGFDANCMVVWDVPDDELDARGEAVGELPYVTLCYHRPRRPEQDWPYNLFTMIHGREADAVDAKIDELAAEYLPVEHERLYSTATLKQTGARYDELVSAGEE
ncbi:siroheme decarboxylase subunit beta [Halobellus limi]|uniref:siroheme decarboxylase n=1 Tax=Halobellus limi TaxID=699433 RepID=A0A1H5TCZ9_9EURY|nr:Lrp/AsnC family transcriptional regulator [Halobellus limi]QCC47357.1 Lrp/AsnC family transcriptional regulator [Halobellus limi]SEF59971.1 DNA-binding transcriptional regulator, Lrp family [Halobellus limi]